MFASKTTDEVDVLGSMLWILLVKYIYVVSIFMFAYDYLSLWRFRFAWNVIQMAPMA